LPPAERRERGRSRRRNARVLVRAQRGAAARGRGHGVQPGSCWLARVQAGECGFGGRRLRESGGGDAGLAMVRASRSARYAACRGVEGRRMDVVRAATVWMAVRPSRGIKEARHARRSGTRVATERTSEGIEYEVTEDRGMKIDIGTRTSTNALVGGGIMSTIYVQLIGLLPFPGLVAALTTPEAIALAATAFAWIVARFSKTPPNPGAI